MTFDKECLIETSDIISVHYECVQCHAAVVIPIEKLNGEKLASYSLSPCSHCQEPSTFQVGASETAALANFIDSLKQIAGAMKGRSRKLRFRIKCE